ncbi:superoxide dismutase family protein [Nannocystis sp. ILAH1]|uniref:superoxide dismutase family protein n=1 Tax=unclassified Nannocystis TaxID=2627009 RepID=UPI00226DEC2C|nr:MULTISPECIES: superoxide dismutase family protein [unclassified Nannocystis]MCY0989909.1 superoxide dismutase family protein [Nannocystis sp. ILAH1]MCY1071054.1 superoxide dismutase family protein [Nannocystis sp. RBIL2]
MRPLTSFIAALSLFSLLGPLACFSSSSGEEGAALATLEPLAGSGVRGTVQFTRVTANRMRVRAQIQGLTPGLHGFHIHEFGDCSAADGSSAGPHFNPEHKMHGGPEGPEHHLGDLGNIEADAGGRAAIAMTTDIITLDTGPRGVLGRSVVVHADPDDLMTEPAGNSGARLACGVIRALSGDTKPILP